MSRFSRRFAAAAAAVVFGFATMGSVLAAESGKAGSKPPVTEQKAASKRVHHKSRVHSRKHVTANRRVREAQEALNRHGARIKADGLLGRHTRAAVMSFQRKHGLKVNGQLDKLTLEKLGVRG